MTFTGRSVQVKRDELISIMTENSEMIEQKYGLSCEVPTSAKSLQELIAELRSVGVFGPTTQVDTLNLSREV